MEIVFWGVRGSLPYAVTSQIIRQKIRSAIELSQGKTFASARDLDVFIDTQLPFSVKGGYGCNTACVEIKAGEEYILCDAGSGLRDFGYALLDRTGSGHQPKVINIFISHLHWDHIQGFPFFVPAFIPDYTINIFGFHDGIGEAFENQQAEPYFPIPFHALQADIRFTRLEIGQQHTIAGVTVSGIRQYHPGQSFGYRFEKDGKSVVYSTDFEHPKEAEREDYPFIEFCRNADALIMDAQYTLIDTIDKKENWGHSSNIMVTELAVRSNVQRLFMFHHEPTCDDEQLARFLSDTRNYLKIYDPNCPMHIDMAYDGMRVKL